MKPIGNGIELDNDSKPEFCEACTKAKSATKPFPKESETRAKKFGDRVHWDLWGPAAVKSLNGHHYVAVCIDDATCETKLYQSGNQIKIVCSDRGGEFLSQKNGTAERGMRTRAEQARALLLAAGLPRFLWEEAMKHITWLQNRTPRWYPRVRNGGIH